MTKPKPDKNKDTNASEDGVMNFSEIQPLVGQFPTPDLHSLTHAEVVLSELRTSKKDLGQYGEIIKWLSTWQGKFPPRLRRPRLCLFAARHHGDKDEFDIPSLMGEDKPLYQTALHVDVDLRFYELDLSETTANGLKQPAMTEDDAARAIAYGMMAVDQGLDVLVLSDVGMKGAQKSAAQLIAAIADGAEAVTKAYAPESDHAFELLKCFGGRDIAAMVGSIIAARLARTPVILEGIAAQAAAAVVADLHPHGIEHCLMLNARVEQTLNHLKTLATMPCGDHPGLAGLQAVSLLKQAAACVGGDA